MPQMNPPAAQTRNRTVSRKERSRVRILDSAARLFKTHGYNGIGLMAIMKDADLTPGAFYAHFKSKEHLFAEVVGMDMEFGLRLVWAREMFPGEPDKGLGYALDYYMGHDNIDKIFTGCALASLTMDIARASDVVRKRFEDALLKLLEEFSADLPDEDQEQRIDNAIAGMALAAGGVSMAKAVADPELAARILNACRQGTRRLTGEAGGEMQVGDNRRLD